MKNRILKALVLICFIIPSMFMLVACKDSNDKINKELDNAQVLTFEMYMYMSNTVEAKAGVTYYFKVTNDAEINHSNYDLDYIEAFEPSDINNKYIGEKKFGIEGSGEYWTIKVYDSNKRKVNFIGSDEYHLYDPMANVFSVKQSETYYFAVTFTEDVSFVFVIGPKEYLKVS